MRAAQKNQLETVLALIKGGADLEGTDKFGDTALEWSADTTPRGKLTLSMDVMKVLIEKGVKGPSKLCGYAESAEELALLELYFETYKAPPPPPEDELNEDEEESVHTHISRSFHVMQYTSRLPLLMAHLV